MAHNEDLNHQKETIMFHPIKAVKTEINLNVRSAREIIAAYKYERMIARSQAKLEETTLVPGVVQIYA
jgi:hypothetical protein